MLYTPQKMLVTGGAGFIGSCFVRYSLAQDPTLQVITLDKLTYAGSLENLRDLPDPARHTFIYGDIADPVRVNQVLRDYHIDTIVHFAAESHVDRSIATPEDFLDTNIVGTYRLLEAARHYWLHEQTLGAEHCRFHHISTDEVFGTLAATDPAFTETTAYAPNSPYSASKASSDHWVRAYFHTYGLPVTLTNCSNNYGPHQHPEKLIPTIIRSCLADQPIPIYGDGSNIRDWLYVMDHCQAIDCVLRHAHPGANYVIGGDQEVSNLTLAHLICAAMDRKFPKKTAHAERIRLVADRPGHDWRYAINAAKINQEFGWHPATTLKQGLEKTIEFYLR